MAVNVETMFSVRKNHGTASGRLLRMHRAPGKPYGLPGLTGRLSRRTYTQTGEQQYPAIRQMSAAQTRACSGW